MNIKAIAGVVVLAMALAGMLGMSLAAYPKGESYISGSGGLVVASDSEIGQSEVDLDTGYLFGVALGHAMADVGDLPGTVRIEGEVTYRGAEDDVLRKTLNVLTVGGNIWYDFSNPDSALTPYVGGGIALGVSEPADDGDLGFQAQIGGGFLYRLSPDLIMGVNYRFFGFDYDDGGLDADNTGHAITASFGIPLN